MKNKKAIALTTLVLMLIVVAVAIVLMRGTLRAEEEIKELSHVEHLLYYLFYPSCIE